MVAEISKVEIKKKYLKPPGISEIESFIKEVGVPLSQFERYFSIPIGVMQHVKRGARPLPVRFWPVFYERIVPQYGTEFTDKTKFQTKTTPKPIPKRDASNSASVANLHDNHTRLTTVK